MKKVKRDDDDDENKNVQWTSRLDFIVSLLGVSLGLADIWRVPYLTYRNGGGAFLIPYVTCLLVCGIPLYYLEVEMAQFSGKGLYQVWDFSPLFRGACMTAFIVSFINMCVYPTMRAWTIEFLVSSFQSTLPWSHCGNVWNTDRCALITASPDTTHLGDNSSLVSINETTVDMPSINITHGSVSAAEEFWQNYILDLSSGMEDVGPINWRYVLYLFITHVLVYLSLARSIKSFSKVMYITALMPIVLILIIWIRALMLPGASKGMAYFITPDFSLLADSRVWIEAGFMASFTLGTGWGTLLTFGCHNKFRENIHADTIIVTIITLCFGLFNGLVAFAVIGVMSEESGIPVPDIITSGGFSLGFVAYPQALTYLPYPQVWSVLFFLVLLMPGMDMQTVTFEPMINVLEERFPKLRKRRLLVLAIVFIVTFACELPFVTRAGAYYFQLIDWYGAAFSLVSVTLLESVLILWVYGGDRVSRDVMMMFGQPLPTFVRVSGAYITPVALFFLLVVSFYSYRPPTYGTYVYPAYANVFGWMIVVVTMLPIFIAMAVQLLQVKGTIFERLRQTTAPLATWRPAVQEYRESYTRSEETRDYSFLKLAWFNLTGHDRLQSNNTTPQISTADECLALTQDAEIHV